MRNPLKRVDAVAVQGAIAAALSFSHIHEVAVATGQTGWQAWAYPVSVDLLLIAAWARARRTGDAMAWFWFAVAVGASLSANLATSGAMDLENPPLALGLIVAGWPAIALLGGTLLGHGARPSAPAAPSEAPVEPAPAPEPPAPVLPEAPPAPALVTVSQAAETLGVSPATVRGWAHNRRLTDHGYSGRSRIVDLAECTQLART